MSEVMGTTEDLTVFLLSDASKSTKRDFYSTILVPPPDSPFRAASTPTLEESASHHVRVSLERRSNVTIGSRAINVCAQNMPHKLWPDSGPTNCACITTSSKLST